VIPAFGVAVIAGGLAAVVRYLVVRAFGPAPFPWAVLLVNVIGSAIGGVVLGLAQAASLAPEEQLVVLGGIAGGLTTFSTLAVGTVQLANGDRRWWAIANMLGSFALGIAAVCAGCSVTTLLV
jgi:CrcB protein